MNGIVSHAQNFEDVILWRALCRVDRGFYVDIGAYDPIDASVSLAFYEHGWRGMHVEPLPEYAKRLRRHRPDEAVIEAAVGDHAGEITLWEAENRGGCSTCDPGVAEQLRSEGIRCKSWTVPCLTTDDLLMPYADRPVHWMKIDVEGGEAAVIRGWSAREVRPWVLVIEATAPNRTDPTHQAWEPDLLAKGYRFAYFDGLNRFYVADERAALAGRLALPPNWFDGFTLGDKHYLIAQRTAQLEHIIQELEHIIQEHEHIIQEHGRLQAQAQAAMAEQRALVAHYQNSLSWRLTSPLRQALRLARGRRSAMPPEMPPEQNAAHGTTAQPQAYASPVPDARAVSATIRLRRRLVRLADNPTTVRLVRPILLKLPGVRQRLQSRLTRMRATSGNQRESAAPLGLAHNLSPEASSIFLALQRTAARRRRTDETTPAPPANAPSH